MASGTRQDDHDQVRRMVSLPADRDRVWAEIGGFGRIGEWHPLIASVELTEIDGDIYRHLATSDGDAYFERLVEEGPHHLTYEMVDGPLPVSDYRATLSCVSEGAGCHVYWSAYFIPADGGGHVLDGIVAKFYEIGLRSIAERFAGETAPAEAVRPVS